MWCVVCGVWCVVCGVCDAAGFRFCGFSILRFLHMVCVCVVSGVSILRVFNFAVFAHGVCVWRGV